MSKVLAGALAAALTVTSVLPAFAANTDETNNLANNDIINTSLTGSLTITKYDMTAAELADAYEEGTYRATGDQNDDLESTMANYALEGVQFTYLKVGEIEQYSYTDPSTGVTSLKVVYEIPTALATILGLDGVTDTDGDTSNDATDMTATGVATTCSNSDVLHYTSDQINAALEALLTDNVTGKNALEDYVKSNASSETMALTDENGQTSVSGLDLGLYLIVETTVPENVNNTTDPFFVSLPMTNLDMAEGGSDGGEYWIYDVYVYPKNQTGNPTLDKMVRNATGTAADTIGESEDMSYIVTNLTDTYETYGALTNQDSDDDVDAADFAAQRGDGTYVSETTTGEYEYSSTTTASTNDILDYILVSKLPHITSNATALAQYTFVDTLSAGLTYNGDMKIAFYESAEDANINNTENALLIWTIPTAGTGATEYFTVQSGTNEDGSTALTVAMTTAGLNVINGVDTNGDTVPADSYSDKYMVVYYSVTVNTNDTTVLGDNGNENNVTLTWERTTSGYTDTLEDQSIVYVYGIDLTKQFADGSTGYTDVQFVLYNKTDGYYVSAEETAAGSGIYYVTGKTTSEDDAAVFVPSAEGSLMIYGLEADTYGLTEIATADGYNLLDSEMVIEITTKSQSIQAAVAGYTGSTKTDMSVLNTTEAASAVDGVESTLTALNGSEHALVKLVVLNTQSFVLPITGGAGLYAVTIIGVIAIAAGLYFFFGRKAQKKESQAQ